MVPKPLKKDDPPKLSLRKKDFTKRNSSRRKLELVEDVVFSSSFFYILES